MATVRARWGRTVQNRPYEPEVFDLSVEMEVVVDNFKDASASASRLHAELRAEGQALVDARLRELGREPETPSADGQSQPSEPDDLVG